MFTTRANQENDVYQQQRVAASKPLNQGVHGLAPKTPGNKAPKTPFRVPLKGENAVQKTGKADKSKLEIFATPAGPQDRAPLGNKTTNAKATVIQTPAPASKIKPSATKPTSPRLKRSKIQVHQAEPEASLHDDNVEEPDIEYAPPREAPLPDNPDDWPYERTFPQFEGRNFTRGWYSEFRPEADSDNDSLGDMEKFQSEMQRLVAEEQQELDQKRELSTEGKRAGVAKTGKVIDNFDVVPATMKARSAVIALSSNTSHGRTPSFAAPTASAKARSVQSATTTQARDTSRVAGNFRHTAAKVASNSTLGYNRGRVVSRTKKVREHSASKESASAIITKAPSAPPPALEQIFGPSLGLEEFADRSDNWDSAALAALEEEDNDFQLES
ncbi:hypothetical protein K431DRAFT_342914 [Polychaeton citri CBS 116435]|uniref:Uncharacterized protein n=1 Tax=Polychaeton citri CBS 116435 TaxID=1314669 RepID=A0A9P4QFH7_9PEZI|nr:hypothetical protein K431DRAFT_342914 [Polychaeton citri CBS 116435]